MLNILVILWDEKNINLPTIMRKKIKIFIVGQIGINDFTD